MELLSGINLLAFRLMNLLLDMIDVVTTKISNGKAYNVGANLMQLFKSLLEDAQLCQLLDLDVEFSESVGFKNIDN